MAAICWNPQFILPIITLKPEKSSNFLGYSVNDLQLILEKFRNKKIWKQNDNQEWFIPNHMND